MKQQFKHKLLSERKCIASILAFYALATASETDEGLNWYRAAHNYCHELAARFGCSISQVAGIIAVYSPQAGWQENKQYALNFLLHPNKDHRSKVADMKTRTIVKLNKEDEIYAALSINNAAWKTKAFFLNILNPEIHTAVTIDRHAIAACIQTPATTEALNESYGKLTVGQYNFFVHCYTEAAKTLDILPHQLQAIVWTVYRRLRELRKYDFDAGFDIGEDTF